jgi:hypothetical protein
MFFSESLEMAFMPSSRSAGSTAGAFVAATLAAGFLSTPDGDERELFLAGRTGASASSLRPKFKLAGFDGSVGFVSLAVAALLRYRLDLLLM